MEAVWWILDVLRRYELFANPKKYQFHNDKVCFLGYIVLAQGVKIEDEQIKAVKNWPEPTSVKDIQVFIGFPNFYQCFIRGFSKIIAPLTSILKTTGLSEELAPKLFGAGNNKVVWGGNGRADKTMGNSFKFKKLKNNKSRNLTCVPIVGITEEFMFLTPDTREAFNHLRQTFIKASILQYFDLEIHIWIETDVSGYAIGGVLS